MSAKPIYVSGNSLEDYRKGAPLNAHQKRRVALIERLLGSIESLGSGLDYGCGLGDLTFIVSPRFEKIVGVDLQQERVDWANEEFAPIEFFVCDQSTLDFPDGTFNTVLSSVVINWVEDPNLYLRTINRVLAEGGHLVLLASAPDRVGQLLRKLRGKSTTTNFDGSMPYDIPTMTAMMKDAGLTVTKVDSYYDPAEDVLTTPKNVIVEFLKLPMRLLGLHSFAQYYGVVARKTSEL